MSALQNSTIFQVAKIENLDQAAQNDFLTQAQDELLAAAMQDERVLSNLPANEKPSLDSELQELKQEQTPAERKATIRNHLTERLSVLVPNLETVVSELSNEFKLGILEERIEMLKDSSPDEAIQQKYQQARQAMDNGDYGTVLSVLNG